MTNNIQQPIQPASQTQDEYILVVKRKDLFFNETAWSGLKAVDFDHYLQIIKNKKQFLLRSAMELDPSYKQIIPYLVFMHDDKLFLMQRTNNSTEARLHNKYTLGIGGHIRQEDLVSDSIFEWAQREFHEEVDYQSPFSIEPLGILNDDSNPVGQVHVGFVFLLRGSSNQISIKSELKSGTLLTLAEAKVHFNAMESWSQIVFEFLLKQ